MKGFFGVDSAFSRVGTILFDIILLNILWIIFSIPIFTMGASTTALYYVSGKIVRNEGYYVIADFWKSFKENFKQATIIGVIFQLLTLIIFFNIRTMYSIAGKIDWIVIIQGFLFIYLVIINIYIYPVLSRFHITIKNSIRTAFYLSIKYLHITLASIVLMVTGLFLIYYAPIYVMVSMSVYAYLTALMFKGIFEKLRQQQENQNSENE